MEEKTTRVDGQYFDKDPYSFELRVNDNIVCQRNFKINGFNSESLTSTQLTDTVRYCAKLIQDSLRSKSNLYYEYTAPQIFKNVAEMREWERCQTDPQAHADGRFQWKIEPLTYVIFEDEEDVYFWDGEKFDKYDKYFDRNAYLPNQHDEATCTLKFAFLVNDVEICSTAWDASNLPRFIRTNIDLSSSKNRYRTSDKFMPFEVAMMDIINDKHRDLIPAIKRELCFACSDDEEYTTKLKYGKKVYKNIPSGRVVNQLMKLMKE